MLNAASFVVGNSSDCDSEMPGVSRLCCNDTKNGLTGAGACVGSAVGLVVLTSAVLASNDSGVGDGANCCSCCCCNCGAPCAVELNANS